MISTLILIQLICVYTTIITVYGHKQAIPAILISLIPILGYGMCIACLIDLINRTRKRI